ncbi:hypothetical protein PGTUg99_027232 [Puccinia graminis f. sp. tritici]|uniref:Uncharacterized protein n=1 Tax=Puccinia graminis f. sp. tritici TaxID=56615 RepID=A0A5B0RKA1_PUCGR|nr:hypothetical protein PGTUg99_027232 [Puccinia graminis f. sp. tritici]
MYLRVQSVLGLALAPLRFGRSSSKPIIHPRRLLNDLAIDNPEASQLSFPAAPQQVLRIELEFSD